MNVTQKQFSSFKRRVTVGYLVLMLGVGFLGLEIAGLVSRLNQNVQSQVHNRTANVQTWCRAINSVINADQEVLQYFKVVGVFRLHDLNCTVLEQKTLRSSQHHG